MVKNIYVPPPTAVTPTRKSANSRKNTSPNTNVIPTTNNPNPVSPNPVPWNKNTITRYKKPKPGKETKGNNKYKK